MSMIFPNNIPLFSKNDQIKNIPFSNVYYEMQNLTSKYIKSRIIQKNLVYLIGLSPHLVQIEPQLTSYEYFGQYGKIVKLVINKNKIYNSNGPNGPSFTCFVTYETEEESSLAILALDNIIIDNHEIKANYGTTKYCLNFLKKWECNNKECIYLHKFADEKDIVSKEIMNTNKDIFPQQRLMAIELSKILTNKKYNELFKSKNIETVFPNGFSVYKKDLVIKYIKEKNLGICLNLNYPKNKITINSHHNNCIELINNYIKAKNSLNSLYKSTPKSRFNFVKENPNLQEKEIGLIVPSQINDFITQQFVRHSLLYKEEQKDLSYYYFSQKPNSLDSDDSWSSLVSLLKRYDNIHENEENMNHENEENMNKKFYTY